MNLSHLNAIVRVRWQIMANRFRKAGLANRIILFTLMILAAVGSLGLFALAAIGGRFFLEKAEPFYVIYAWDVLAAAFLFAWAVALMVELQRSELLSLRNLLHLPVSLSGAFFLNYASSLVSLTVLLFLPPMLGFCLASVLHFGIGSLVVFALLASFLLMVTAVSYQLRGWLARLMENKRKRGTVIAVTTGFFVLIFQLPNLVNVRISQSRLAAYQQENEAEATRLTELQQRLERKEIGPEEYAAAVESSQQESEKQRAEFRAARTAATNRTAAIVNATLPIGWLPYGASAAASGAVVRPWLCVLGMSTIGATSLALAYRSTLRTYTGAHNSAYQPATQSRTQAFVAGSLLEKRLPLLTEAQTATALATFRSLLRAPEAKMALLTPLIFACVFGSMLATGAIDKLPVVVRPWIGIGALGMSLFGMAQMMLNMFGLDRHGFRAYVLAPAPRRDVLLGKNMGLFPLASVLSALLVLFCGVVGRMEFVHIAATLLQIVVAYLVYFTISNFTSIVAPMGMAAGTMKPVSMSASVIVWQLAAILLAPAALIPAALALAAEQFAGAITSIHGIPIYLLLTALELPIVFWFYNRMLNLQGRLLQEREQTILAVVSKTSD
jgi:ABC-2 type transport system permease protein